MLYYEIIKEHPADKTAIIFKDQKISFGELRTKVDNWANFFQAQGIQKGDKIGIISKNSADYVAAYLAIVKAGGVVVPLNFQLIAPEVAYIVKDTDMKILIAQKKVDLTAALDELSCENIPKQYDFEDLNAMGTSLQHEFVQPNMSEQDNCVIIYTSGTTGRPKGAMLSHKNLIANTQAIIKAVNFTEKDMALCVLPMYHCFGWICCVSANLYTGATIVVQEVFMFSDAMNLVRTYGVDVICAVPTMYQLFVKSTTPEDLKQLRVLVCGGASLPRTLAEAFRDKFGIPVQEGYGLSEATPVVAVNPAEKIKIGSIGIPLPGVTVKIMDENMKETAAGEVGELCVQGPNVMLGYWDRPKATEKALRGGWLHTEDVAYKDEEGYLFIVDRLKDMIIASGENVYPREVEEALLTHPDVADTAVIGVPDSLRGQIVCAYVVPADGAVLDKRSLRKYLLTRIAQYKVPKEYVFCEQLPRNNTGKIVKGVLREKAVEDLVHSKKG